MWLYFIVIKVVTTSLYLPGIGVAAMWLYFIVIKVVTTSLYLLEIEVVKNHIKDCIIIDVIPDKSAEEQPKIFQL